MAIAIIGATNTANAASSRGVALSAEEHMLLDATDGALEEHDLFTAVLIASGGSASEMPNLRERFEHWLASCADLRTAETSERAELIFKRLHGQLLQGEYQATCSDVAIALDTGDFNCLSATVLFVCAARHCKLEAHALATEGHVLAEIAGETGHLEVETTCPRWFELSLADARAARQLRLAASAVDAESACRVRRLTDVELLAKVYYNRGVSALRSSDYEAGLRLTRISLRLDPHDEVARGNELAGLNNWALAECRAGNLSRAAELLAELRAIDPHYPTLADNAAYFERSRGR